MPHRIRKKTTKHGIELLRRALGLLDRVSGELAEGEQRSLLQHVQTGVNQLLNEAERSRENLKGSTR